MGLNQLTMRAPEPADGPAISRTDAEGLATGHASFRAKPHDWGSFSASFLTARGLALVAEDDNGIAGWAGVSPTSAKPVYRGVGEVSIYVSADRKGQGIGRQLLEALIQKAEQAGYWTLVAQIFPENEVSLKLHAACGFQTLGTRIKLGKMTYGPHDGKWRDVIMLERRSKIVS
ncbi:MAG: GNAT family N-acetyltransferase [Pelagimonas sp.]|jgi:phosphinothricin acetyltransferase|nr:GNAT family N-acetyltransferase [Pelagimonas sp.]